MGVPVKTGFGLMFLAGGLAVGAAGQDKPAMADAQIEANVLKALASAPELSTQNIQTTTVYGVVTLSGSAVDEASRTKAENLAARAPGVKKVVDEMTLGPTTVTGNGGQPANGSDQANNLVLQSDGTYAPAQEDQGPPQPTGAPEPGFTSPPAPPATAQGGQYPPQGQYPQGQNQQGQYPQDGGQYPQQGYPQQGYPQQGNVQYPPQGGYPPPPPNGYPPRRVVRSQQQPYPDVPGGQVAGKVVTVPAGALVRIRINQGLSSKHTQPGSVFDGTVLNDVVADGAVAIPRGASIQGTVIDAKNAGAVKGRSELALQLTRLTLGGQSYALVSDTWSENGPDKATHTVNSAIGLGALGAVIGAVAGGGSGAAIGAGVGGAAGIASSASSPGGRVIVPPEAVLTFHLAQPAQVTTVSEQEMARLSYAAGPGGAPQPVVRRRAYPGPYYGPYPGYYPPQ